MVCENKEDFFLPFYSPQALTQFSEQSPIVSSEALPVINIWIDGSFVSQKEQPNDVDIVIFSKDLSFKSIEEALAKASFTLVNLDVKWVRILDKPDEQSSAIDALERMKWFILFSSDRNGLPKGFINLKID